MSSLPPGTKTSAFVERWVRTAARELGVPGVCRSALDLAAGDGRHAALLSEAGFTTFGVDLSVDRLRTARDRARTSRADLHLWAADLHSWPFPRAGFDVLVVSRFLLRARWDDLRDLVKPGGFVVYETFTMEQLTRGFGPRSLDHLLHPGELVHAFGDWEILFAEEVIEPAAMARLAARKPVS